MSAASGHQTTIPPVDLACVLDVLHDVTTLLCAIHQACKRLANEQIPIEHRDPTLAVAISNEAIGRFKSLWDIVHVTTQPDLPGHTPVIDLADTVQAVVAQTWTLVELYARAMDPRPVPSIVFEGEGLSVPVRAFKQVIARVIQNLIINSFQAGASTIQITLTIKLGEAVLVVQDNGPGFPAQVLEQVRPGYTTKLDGHGLGLVATIANVQQLGGSVELENRSGALVTVKLSIVQEEE